MAGMDANLMTAPPKLAPRIVIVDDHPNTASMLARAMAQFNRPMEVLTARGGQEALEVIGEQPVDVLITDFMMPGMNGLELIEKLQKSREPAHVILVTAYDSPGLAATARRLKVGHYLVKPVQPDKIREIVSKILESGAPAARAQIADMPPPSSFKILIADDQPDNVRLLATRLEAEGYAFVTAADGDESLSKVYSERPDLLLLDVNMPKKSGFEVLAEMRGDPEVAHIPVIILTAARISPRDVREGLTLGADDYITKPFDWRDLAARLRSKLRVKHAEDVLRRRNRELSLLPEIGQDLTARLDVEELADVVLQRAVETLDAASGHLLVFPPEGKIFSKDFSVRRIGGWAWSELQDQLMATGLIGYVLEQRAGAFLADAQTADHWPHLEDDAVRAAISVPLLSRHGAIGALTLVHEAAGHFNADHITLLQAIASQAAIAIENAQLVAIERKRVGELVALNQITREISLFTHSAEMFDRLPLLIRENLNYPAVTLWLVEPDGMSLRAQSGMEDAPRPSILALAPTQVVETGKPANLSGSVEERTGARAGVGVPPMHSTVAVPLFWEARVSGVLAIHSRQPHAFQESERVLLETLAAQMVSALERIRLFESVE